jgi:hypothetical protein
MLLSSSVTGLGSTTLMSGSRLIQVDWKKRRRACLTSALRCFELLVVTDMCSLEELSKKP